MSVAVAHDSVPVAPDQPWPRRVAVQRGLAGLLVALLAALSALLSAAPADAARLTARAVPAATSPASPTVPAGSTGQETRRGPRSAAHRSAASVGRRPADRPAVSRRLADGAGALRQARPQRGGTVHQPTAPATGSIDATGPPSSYDVATVRPSNLRLGEHDYPAAAGRAPPSSCGS